MYGLGLLARGLRGLAGTPRARAARPLDALAATGDRRRRPRRWRHAADDLRGRARRSAWSMRACSRSGPRSRSSSAHSSARRSRARCCRWRWRSESLLVITIGVVWTRLATGRRGAAIANLLLGAGLMLYGLHLLQTSIQPLVSDPKILPYIGYLPRRGAPRAGDLRARRRAARARAAGPGPGLRPRDRDRPDQWCASRWRTRSRSSPAPTSARRSGMALIAWQSGRSVRPLVVASPRVRRVRDGVRAGDDPGVDGAPARRRRARVRPARDPARGVAAARDRVRGHRARPPSRCGWSSSLR